MLRSALVLAGWCGAAFLVYTAFGLATFWFGERASAALLYVVGLAATFPLHAATRGPWLTAGAFGVCWALFVAGIAFAATAEGVSPGFGALVVALLAVPLVALVARCSQRDARDAEFERHRRWVLPAALAVATPLLVAGLRGATANEPTPYERALHALGYTIATMGPVVPKQDLMYVPTPSSRLDWAGFQFPRSDVAPAVRVDVERACGSYVRNDDRQADCAYEYLTSRLAVLRQRRKAFRLVALASALPLGILLLFTWRGRRRAPGVHASATE